MQYLTNLVSSFNFPVITESLYTRNDGIWSKSTDEKKEGFFERLTDVNSQRENWYEVTPYIAEYYCTVSNVVIISAGILSKSPELVFAGTASAVSHAIPKHWLLQIDKLGAALVAARIISNIASAPQTVIENPELLLLPLTAITIHNADVILARTKGHKWSHVVWHCASGSLVGLFLAMTSNNGPAQQSCQILNEL